MSAPVEVMEAHKMATFFTVEPSLTGVQITWADTSLNWACIQPDAAEELADRLCAAAKESRARRA